MARPMARVASFEAMQNNETPEYDNLAPVRRGLE